MDSKKAWDKIQNWKRIWRRAEPISYYTIIAALAILFEQTVTGSLPVFWGAVVNYWLWILGGFVFAIVFAFEIRKLNRKITVTPWFLAALLSLTCFSMRNQIVKLEQPKFLINKEADDRFYSLQHSTNLADLSIEGRRLFEAGDYIHSWKCFDASYMTESDRYVNDRVYRAASLLAITPPPDGWANFQVEMDSMVDDIRKKVSLNIKGSTDRLVFYNKSAYLNTVIISLNKVASKLPSGSTEQKAVYKITDEVMEQKRIVDHRP